MRPEPFGIPDAEPLRIAVVSMHTSPTDRPGKGDAGGLNVLVLESAMALAARGHHVDVFTRSAGAPHSHAIASGVTLYALATGGGVVRKHELPNLADAFGAELERAALAATDSYDVIHAHYWLSGLAALPVSLSLGIPIVQTFHTLAEEKNRRLATDERPEPERRVLTERYLAGEVDAIAAVSRAEVDVLCDGIGASAERVWLVPPAVDALLFQPRPVASRAEVRARLGVRPDDGLVVCVGRVQPLKGQDLAVRMLEHLPDAVLVVGSKLGEAELWGNELTPTGAVIRVDIDPAQLDKNLAATIRLEGDARATIETLVARVEREPAEPQLATVRESLVEAARDFAPREMAAAEAIAAGIPQGAVVSGDSSQITYYGMTSAVRQDAPASMPYMPAYATLGYGLPAAIGAKLATPAAPVLVVTGDGALMFSVQELVTAVEQRLDLAVVVVDNGGYGEIEQNEANRGIDPIGVRLHQPDWVALARAFGASGMRVDSASTVTRMVLSVSD